MPQTTTNIFRRNPLEFLAGGFGLIIALILINIRVSHWVPYEPSKQYIGDIAFALFFVAPYIIALLSVILPPGSRWVVLLPATLMSGIAMIFGVSGITLILAPAVALLGGAGLLPLGLENN